MVSDRGGRLEILHWSGSFSSLFVEKYNDFVLIDGTRKTNIYDLSLVVTIMVDSLGVLVPDGVLLLLQQNSPSIESHHDQKIGSNPSNDLYGNISCTIMTDEGSALVKLVSSISSYNHCLCFFHVN